MAKYEISNKIAVGNFFVYRVCAWDLLPSINHSSQDYAVVTQPMFL